jgi:hypothetical protein
MGLKHAFPRICSPMVSLLGLTLLSQSTTFAEDTSGPIELLKASLACTHLVKPMISQWVDGKFAEVYLEKIIYVGDSNHYRIKVIGTETYTGPYVMKHHFFASYSANFSEIRATASSDGAGSFLKIECLNHKGCLRAEEQVKWDSMWLGSGSKSECWDTRLCQKPQDDENHVLAGSFTSLRLCNADAVRDATDAINALATASRGK